MTLKENLRYKYLHGDSLAGDALKRIEELERQRDDLLAALDTITSMCEVHGDFTNGVTDPTGSIDEGDVIAGEIISKARSTITSVKGE